MRGAIHAAPARRLMKPQPRVRVGLLGRHQVVGPKRLASDVMRSATIHDVARDLKFDNRPSSSTRSTYTPSLPNGDATVLATWLQFDPRVAFGAWWVTALTGRPIRFRNRGRKREP